MCRCVTLATAGALPRVYPAAMEQDEIEQLVARAIRAHELRVALWSGLFGAALMAGTWHAIWLCR